jgi:hypothetical protein
MTTAMPLGLDRWMSNAREQRVCACAECRARRAQPFVCTTCGFSNTPLVLPCECVDGDRRHIVALRSAVLEARALGRDRVFAFTPREAKAALRQAVDAALNDACSAADPRCAHGCVECPACASVETNRTRGWTEPMQAG